MIRCISVDAPPGLISDLEGRQSAKLVARPPVLPAVRACGDALNTADAEVVLAVFPDPVLAHGWSRGLPSIIVLRFFSVVSGLQSGTIVREDIFLFSFE